MELLEQVLTLVLLRMMFAELPVSALRVVTEPFIRGASKIEVSLSCRSYVQWEK